MNAPHWLFCVGIGSFIHARRIIWTEYNLRTKQIEQNNIVSVVLRLNMLCGDATRLEASAVNVAVASMWVWMRECVICLFKIYEATCLIRGSMCFCGPCYLHSQAEWLFVQAHRSLLSLGMSHNFREWEGICDVAPVIFEIVSATHVADVGLWLWMAIFENEK